jgi:hypothetical protein
MDRAYNTGAAVHPLRRPSITRVALVDGEVTGGTPLLALFEKWAATLPTPLCGFRSTPFLKLSIYPDYTHNPGLRVRAAPPFVVFERWAPRTLASRDFPHPQFGLLGFVDQPPGRLLGGLNDRSYSTPTVPVRAPVRASPVCGGYNAVFPRAVLFIY